MRKESLAFFIFVLFSLGSAAVAQDIWEYSPYDVRVWVALDSVAELPTTLHPGIARTLRWMADIVDGSAWRVSVSTAPDRWQSSIVHGLAELTLPEDPTGEHPLYQGDKLTLIGVAITPAGYRIQARQLDCRLRQLGPLIEYTTWQTERIALLAFSALRESFVPVVRIEKVRGKQAQTRARAGGLTSGPQSPAWIPDDAVLVPIIRRNDRIGHLTENGIRPIPWTLLVVKQREGARIVCEVHSGMRAPISGRASPRIEKLAMVARPSGEQTNLKLVSVADDQEALSGYQVYARRLDAPDSDLLGVTNWQGEVLVRRDTTQTMATTSDIRVLYVRSGTRLLARLPLIPGLVENLTAEIPNDDPRLVAEGVIEGLKNHFMDLIAQRQILAARIRSLIEQGEFDSAEQLIDQLRELESRPEFSARLDLEEQRLAVDNDNLQQRIDALFNDLRRLLGAHLDPQLPNRLASEVAAARGRNG